MIRPDLPPPAEITDPCDRLGPQGEGNPSELHPRLFSHRQGGQRWNGMQVLALLNHLDRTRGSTVSRPSGR